MPQSEMEALLQLQKETIESLRQLVESQRLTIEQMSKSHEEQTAQLNQTIANLNETVEYLKKKLFASSSEKSNKDVFPGQINLFNEAEAAADPSVPEPTLEEAVRGYNRQARKPKGCQGRDPGRTAGDRSPMYSAGRGQELPLLQYSDGSHRGKRLSVRNCGLPLQKWNGSSMSRKSLAVQNARKTALPLSLELKHQARC